MIEVPWWIPEPEFDLPTTTMEVNFEDHVEDATKVLPIVTQIWKLGPGFEP
jgi:hypothetical protein